MYKSCLFFLGMVLFFTAVPSLADESRYDEPTYLLWRRLLENDIDDKNPKPRDKQERSLDENVEEKSPFAGEKTPDDKQERGLAEDVEEKSPFAGEKTPDDKQERGLEEAVEEKSPFAGEKTPDEKEETRKLESDLVDKRKRPKRLLSAGNPNRKRILATDDVEEKSPFAGEKTPDEKEEKKLLENDPLPPQYKRGRLLSVDVEGYNPNLKRILATDGEVENPLYVEKIGRLLEETKTRKLNVDESANDEGEKLGRLLADELKKSPFYDGKTSNYDIENPKGPAKAPGMSPSKKPQRKGRTDGSFYVEKPREHQPLITNPQKSPNRRLLGESLGQ